MHMDDDEDMESKLSFYVNGNGRYLGLVAFYIIFPTKWEKSMLLFWLFSLHTES